MLCPPSGLFDFQMGECMAMVDASVRDFFLFSFVFECCCAGCVPPFLQIKEERKAKQEGPVFVSQSSDEVLIFSLFLCFDPDC
jgi:hypothetical protein